MLVERIRHVQPGSIQIPAEIGQENTSRVFFLPWFGATFLNLWGLRSFCVSLCSSLPCRAPCPSCLWPNSGVRSLSKDHVKMFFFDGVSVSVCKDFEDASRM